MRVLPAAVVVAVITLTLAAPGGAAVVVVEPFPLERYANEGAIGLAVPGAGPTVTRESALNALLTGKVESSYLGGTPAGAPKLDLDGGGGPDVVVVLPPEGTSDNDRYPIALLGGERGVLTSDSTRIAGLVSITDVANGKLRVEEVDDPVAVVERLEQRIERNDRIRTPLQVLVLTVAILAALVAPRFGPRVILVALALNLWLAGWWLVIPLALAVALLPLGVACAAVVAAYLAALGLDPESVALAPLGPSQAARFYGVTNLLETLLLVPALLGTALLGRLGVLVAAGSLVAVAGNRFGADGGGLLVLLAGFATLWLLRARARLTGRRVAVLATAVVASAALLVGIDAAAGGSSHVTEAVGDGPGALAGDLADRIELSVRRTVAWAPGLVSLLSLGLLAWIATRRPGPVTASLLVALAVSIVVNDTPADVLSTGAACALVLHRFERHGVE